MEEHVIYQRSRFSTELPTGRRYTAGHCWLEAEPDGVWLIGCTQFFTWLSGEPVEFEFSVALGAAITSGQDIGWMEGLKSLHTLYSAADGEFLGAGDITQIETGLYRVRGTPEPGTLDATQYAALLDGEVDAACGGRCDA